MNTESDYIIGIDHYRYDGSTAVCVVMKRVENNNTEIVAQYKGRPRVDFEAEVAKLIEYYKIPESRILKQP